MKYIFFIFSIILFLNNTNAQTIATFKIANIFDNLTIYKTFMKKINDFKDIKFQDLLKEEQKLIEKKKEIENSKISAWLERAAQDEEFKIKTETVELSGLCIRCQPS